MAKKVLIPVGVPFTQIPWEAIEDHGIDPFEFRVYCYLMRRANSATGRAFPSQRTIAEDLGMSKGKVNAAIKSLMSEGWIEVAERVDTGEPKHRQRIVYRVLGQRVPRLFNPDRTTTETGSPHEPVHGTVRTVSREGTEPYHGKVHNKNQQLEPELQPSKQRHDALVYALVDAIGYVKEEITEPAWGRLHRAAKTLNEVGADPGEVADRVLAYRVNFNGAAVTPTAIAANWADLAQLSRKVSDRRIRAVSAQQTAREAVRQAAGRGDTARNAIGRVDTPPDRERAEYDG